MTVKELIEKLSKHSPDMLVTVRPDPFNIYTKFNLHTMWSNVHKSNTLVFTPNKD